MQHPGDGADPPAREPRGGQMRRFGQTQRDLPHAEVLVDVPAEDLPHDLRLGLRHLDVGRDAVTPWNPPVAVGDLPPAHFALSRAKELASTVAFRDLDAFGTSTTREYQRNYCENAASPMNTGVLRIS